MLGPMGSLRGTGRRAHPSTFGWTPMHGPPRTACSRGPRCLRPQGPPFVEDVPGSEVLYASEPPRGTGAGGFLGDTFFCFVKNLILAS